MATRDFDAVLLGIDWSTNDWRDFDWTEITPHLYTLRDETVHALARAHNRQGADELSPIHLEQLNRFRLHSDAVSENPETPTGKPIRQYFVAEGLADNDATFTNQYGVLPPEAEFEGHKVRSTFTASAIFEVAIAAMTASGVKYDPHPADPRTLLTDPDDRHKYDPALANDIRDDVVRLLNGAGVRAIAKRPEETCSRYQADVRAATIAEYGVDPEDPSGSPTRPRYAKATEDEAQKYYNHSLAGTLELRAAAYTWEMLTKRCDWVRTDLQNRGVFDARSVHAISERHDALLKLSWFKAKRDLFHIYIPGMQPRYRAWSVSPWTKKPRASAGGGAPPPPIPWFGISRRDYNPQAFGTDDPSVPFPEESYKWFYGQVYTPVMPMDLAHSVRMRDRFEWVCRALRTKYRVHKDMGMLELGTTVHVGHTLGFTLLDLKKVATLWALAEGTLALLHRKHRWDHHGRAGSGAVYAGGLSITEYSRLGAACRYAAAAAAAENPENPDPASASIPPPDFPPDEVFPRLSPAAWDHLIDREMSYWVPPDWLWSLGRPEQMFVHAVWAYEDITSLARALEPRWPNIQVSLWVRCRGDRRTGLPTEDDNTAGGVGVAAAAAANARTGLAGRVPQTIEFGHMQASVDGAHVAMWMVVCAAFVHFCCAQDDNRDAYYALFADQDNLLAKLGLPQDVQDHFAKGFGHGAGSGNLYWEPEDPDDRTVNWDHPFYPPYIRPEPAPEEQL